MTSLIPSNHELHMLDRMYSYMKDEGLLHRPIREDRGTTTVLESYVAHEDDSLCPLYMIEWADGYSMVLCAHDERQP